MDMKRFFLYAIVIAAMALAGCGGNGGGGTGPNTGMPTGPTASDMTVTAVITALNAAGANLAADASSNDIVAAINALSAENPAVAALRAHLGLPADATLAMISQTVADRLPLSEDPNPVATKAAGTKRTAIATEAAQVPTGGTVGTDGAGGADAGLGGSSAPADGNTGAYTLAIKRDPDSMTGAHNTTVTVTVEGATDAADEKFVQAMDLGDGPMGYRTTMHTRTMDADDDGNVVVEVAMVTTDIEAPVPMDFENVHTLDVRVDGGTATEAMPNDALNVVPANLAHVKASAFTAPAGTTGSIILSFQQAVAADPGNNIDAMDAAEIMGTYEGAMGTYKCNATGAACTVSVNTMGVVSAVSNPNDWIFIPASGAKVDVADTDYLHYGFWLQKTTDSDGATTYNEVETFAGSSVPASGSVTAVTGTATYSGGATGVFVHNVTGQDGNEILATSGHFTADASLTATFGQVLADSNDQNSGTIAPNMLNTLTGTIDDFQLAGHTQGPGWSVALQGDITEIAGTASGTAMGGMGDGSFNATFHGSTDDGNGNATVKPSSVVGEFNAGFSNGSVAGAFGARQNP